MGKYTAEQVEAVADAYFQDTEDVDQCGAMLRAFAAAMRQQDGRVDEMAIMEVAIELRNRNSETVSYRKGREWADKLQAALAQSAQGDCEADFSMVFGDCTVTGRKDDVLLVAKIMGDPDDDHAERARVPALLAALNAVHYYIDATDRELAEDGITRERALRTARDLREAAAPSHPAQEECQRKCPDFPNCPNLGCLCQPAQDAEVRHG